MVDFSAIVFDIDDTLLNSSGYILDTTIAAIKNCIQKDLTIYLATARPERLVFRSFEVPRKEADYLTNRAVFYNGAIAIDKELSYYYHRSISAQTVDSITNSLIATLPDLNIAIQSENVYHSYRLPMDTAEIRKWGFSPDELLPFSEAQKRPCSKIVAWHKSKDLSEVYDDLSVNYSKKANVFITDSHRWIQITDHSATKENALLGLLSERNISPNKVVVFGDDIPDLGMFKTFRYSIAMGNAPKRLKKAATFVTLSNDAHGINYAFENFLWH